MIVIFGLLLSFVCGEDYVATYYLTTKGDTYKIDIDYNTRLINPLYPVKFIIHGWTENAHLPHYVDMARAFLYTGDYNVIRVDYSGLAKQEYPTAVRGVETIGKQVAEFIARLHSDVKIPLSNVHVIGHSLGGQVSGSVGKNVLAMTGGRIARITGLDPARPLFETPFNFNVSKLSKTDADMVDVVHTDAGVQGLRRPTGTLDFFPNGGTRLQPGCNYSFDFTSDLLQQFDRDMDGIKPSDKFCSHQRSYRYFTESIVRQVEATKCDSWQNYLDGSCDCNEKIIFGANAPTSATGNYYLITGGQSPYLHTRTRTTNRCKTSR